MSNKIIVALSATIITTICVYATKRKYDNQIAQMKKFTEDMEAYRANHYAKNGGWMVSPNASAEMREDIMRSMGDIESILGKEVCNELRQSVMETRRATGM